MNWMVERIIEIAEQLRATRNELIDYEEALRALVEELQPVAGWVFPVGDDEFPTADWYCACWHSLDGSLNDGYGHTGIDLNVDRYPWGDVDRGRPVWAVADGIVYAAHYSTNYLGGIVIRSEHEGDALYIRYWHLEDNDAFRAHVPGQHIAAGQLVGNIGNYLLGAGGDHLHFDMALDPFEPHWWFTRHEIRWVDPVPVLRTHLNSDLVEEMLRRA